MAPDLDLTAEALDFETVRLDVVQRAMENQANTNILFLDACRDNPLARNLARQWALAQVKLAAVSLPRHRAMAH